MATNQQFVISLSRLVLPEDSKLKKITLSIVSASSQHFIESSRMVKENKVNFYRQNLFIHQISNRISFNIYQIDQDASKRVVITFLVGNQELEKIHKRPTFFKICQQGYELSWDSWIFNEDSQNFDNCSQRDYSELDLPFDNEAYELSYDEIAQNSQVQRNRVSYLSRQSDICQRSTSTDEASSEEEIRTSSSQKNKTQDAQSDKENSTNKLRKTINANKKQKKYMKAQIYTKIISGISGLLSRAKSP